MEAGVARSTDDRPRSRVAVLMAAYNAERTIRQAVDSILANTFAADLFIVDDCSKVPVAVTLADLGDRITVMRLPVNSGPSEARNQGLRRILAEGYEFVAIMDADDAAYPDRIALQVAHLDAHPDVGAVGGFIRMMEETSFEPVWVQQYPIDDDGIRRAMFFNFAMAHPTILFRSTVLAAAGDYDRAMRTAEDYDLLRRIQRSWRLANLPRVVLDYRLSLHGQSMGNRRRQLHDRLMVQLRGFEPLAWRAWVGVLWTLVLFLVPMRVKMALKVLLGRPGLPASSVGGDASGAGRP